MNVIIPVAVTAVSNCRISVRILVYSGEMGLRAKNLPCVFFLVEYLSERPVDSTVLDVCRSQ